VKQGLSDPRAWSVLAARDGSIWMGSVDGLTVAGRPDHALSTREGEWSGVALRGHRRTPLGLHIARRSYFSTGDASGGFAVYREDRSYAFDGDQDGNVWVANQDAGLFHLTHGSLSKRILGPCSVAAARRPRFFSIPCEAGCG